MNSDIKLTFRKFLSPIEAAAKALNNKLEEYGLKDHSVAIESGILVMSIKYSDLYHMEGFKEFNGFPVKIKCS